MITDCIALPPASVCDAVYSRVAMVTCFSPGLLLFPSQLSFSTATRFQGCAGILNYLQASSLLTWLNYKTQTHTSCRDGTGLVEILSKKQK